MKRSYLLFILVLFTLAVYGQKVTRKTLPDGTRFDETSFQRCYNFWNDGAYDKFDISLRRSVNVQDQDTTFLLVIRHKYSYYFDVEAGDTLTLKDSSSSNGDMILTCDSVLPDGKTLDFGSTPPQMNRPGTVTIPIPKGMKEKHIWICKLSSEQLEKLIEKKIDRILLGKDESQPYIKIEKNRLVSAIKKAYCKIRTGK